MIITLAKGARVRARWPDDIRGVVLGPGIEPNHVRVFWHATLLVTDTPISRLALDFSRENQS
jgi:hypothetical protein